MTIEDRIEMEVRSGREWRCFTKEFEEVFIHLYTIHLGSQQPSYVTNKGLL
ncbi:hypothetical protein FACS189485_14320 [Spirochaetia bacterium]|nr:hypothetical protein FACS189485_14320 [Spirochaetia bacterium]